MGQSERNRVVECVSGEGRTAVSAWAWDCACVYACVSVWGVDIDGGFAEEGEQVEEEWGEGWVG